MKRKRPTTDASDKNRIVETTSTEEVVQEIKRQLDDFSKYPQLIKSSIDKLIENHGPAIANTLTTDKMYLVEKIVQLFFLRRNLVL